MKRNNKGLNRKYINNIAIVEFPNETMESIAEAERILNKYIALHGIKN